jgi:hypothetical protein
MLLIKTIKKYYGNIMSEKRKFFPLVEFDS